MKIGTKSVLYGAHCFAFHWAFVALAWWKLYGFRAVRIGTRDGLMARPVSASLWHPALWLAFLVHDIGYIGRPNMDGPEGELHPEVGAAILRRIFGEPWGRFVLYHSRFLAKQRGAKASALCVADKLATVLTPRWLYLPMVKATGEVHEYMDRAKQKEGAKYASANVATDDINAWHADMTAYMRRWVEEHKDGRDDTWTPARS